MQGPWSRRMVWVLVIVTAAASIRFRYVGADGLAWREAINNDGKHYYEYVRMCLFGERKDPGLGHGLFKAEVEGGLINHFGGAAALMAPAVLAAHAITLLRSGGPEDGYSLYYQVAVGLAAVFWLAVGLLATRRLLLGLGHADAVVAITLPLLTLGTGLITQAVVHPAMSHVYGVAIIALFLLGSRRFLESPSGPKLIACVALLALCAWIRPVNALVILAAPATAMGLRIDAHRMGRALLSAHGALAVAAGLCIVLLQGVLWWLQTGSFIARPYPGEGFHWARPEVINSLFSARNGLLFYWPAMLLPFAGMLLMPRRERNAAWWLIAFTVTFGYVTASWWNWAYGDNFGQRTYLDMLAVFAIAMPFAIPKSGAARASLMVVGAAACALNLFQSWQYSQHILWTGQMHAEQYAHLFLRTDPARALELGGHDDMPLYAPKGYAESGALKPTEIQRLDDEQVLAYAALPRGSARLEFRIARTELAPGASRDTWLTIALQQGPAMKRLHRFRLNRVPDGGTIRSWRHAYNLGSGAPGDTLVILGDGLARCRIDALEGRLLTRR